MEVEGLRMPAFVGLCATARDGLLRENHRRSGERAAGVQTLCGNDLALSRCGGAACNRGAGPVDTHRMIKSGLHLLMLSSTAAALQRAQSHAMLDRRQALTAASTSAWLLASGSACSATVESLTDEEGNFVVDPRKANAGLMDPLAEPVGAYSTISAAVAVAPSGATIIVRPGVYNERVTIIRPITLMADGDVTLSWKSDRPYEAALTVALERPISPAASTSRVVVSGLSVRHFSPSIAQNYAVYVPQPTSAAADGVGIEFQRCAITSGSGSGVGVEGGDVTLERCQIASCKNHGVVYLGQTSRGKITNCTVEQCKLNGVLLRDGASPTLEGNRLRANGQYGAALIDCRGRYLKGNDAAGNGKGAVSGECDYYDEDG